MSDVIEYKCPSCNASMVFDSKSQHMKCPYCDTEMTVEEFQRTQKSEDTQTTGKSISNDNWYSMSTVSYTHLILIMACGADPAEAYSLFFRGIFGTPAAFAEIFVKACPLILTGLGLSLIHI